MSKLVLPPFFHLSLLFEVNILVFRLYTNNRNKNNIFCNDEWNKGFQNAAPDPLQHLA